MKLRDELKNILTFLICSSTIEQNIETIFSEQQVIIQDHLSNGLSHICEDVRIARYIVETGFTQEFKSLELKGGCHATIDLIKDQFWVFYKERFERQINQVMHRLEGMNGVN